MKHLKNENNDYKAVVCGKGYDVLSDSFFVVEDDPEVCENQIKRFKNFKDFYNYLGGDIYDNSCYWQLELSDEMKSEYNLDTSLMFQNDHIFDCQESVEVPEETDSIKREENHKPEKRKAGTGRPDRNAPGKAGSGGKRSHAPGRGAERK